MVLARPPVLPDPGRGALRTWVTRIGDGMEAVPMMRMPGLGRDSSVLVYAWFLWGLGTGLWAYTWPVFLSGLGADSVEVGAVIGIGSLIATLVYLPGGFVAQYGYHKWQTVVLHGLHTVATGTFVMATSWWHVVPGVFVQNFVALLAPAVNSFLTRIADEERIGVARLYSVIGSAQFVAMTVSPPVGGWVAREFGDGAVFPLALIGCGLSVTMMAMLRSHTGPSRVDDTGAPLDPAVSAAPSTTTRPSAFSQGWDVYRSLLAMPVIRMLLATSLAIHASIHLAVQFAPLFLREEYGFDSAAIGWTGSAASAGAALLVLLIDRVRRRRGLLVAMYVACALTAAHYVLILSSPLLAVQLVGYAGRGAMAALGTLITVALTDWCPRSQVAGGVALLATAAGVAAIIFPPLGGWLYSIDPRAPFAMAVVVIGGAQFLVWRTFRARREDAIPSVVAV